MLYLSFPVDVLLNHYIDLFQKDIYTSLISLMIDQAQCLTYFLIVRQMPSVNLSTIG